MTGRVRRSAWLAAALIVAIAVGLIVGRMVAARAGARFVAEATADARLRQALLASEVARFRLLPLALADDREVGAALGRGDPGTIRALNGKLERLAGITGAAAIYVIGAGGRTIAASNWRTARSFVGQDYRYRRYWRDARTRGSGEQFALGSVSGRPGLYLTRRTREGGVVVVKLEFDSVERQWRGAGGVTFVTDARGVVLVTSRADWRFRITQGADAPYRAVAGGRVSIPGTAGPWLLVATAPDARGWRVNLALPTRGVDALARGAVIGAGLATLALLSLAAWWRARTRRRGARTAALEMAVAARTAQLSREIAERAAVEARAATLREGLRQANRLATLGQVTASVAHETAQPVAAIRNYAATGEQWLNRGDMDAVRGNLRAIARLTERIGETTAQLRGFARKGTGAIGPVALAEAVEGAMLILKERLSRVAFEAPAIPADLRVVAGLVRLEQVIVNLLQNAVEALDGREDGRITMTVEMGDGNGGVTLTIADNGPGVAPEIAARLFTPFATSRADGLGLGLVIAHDIMADMGGALRLVPGGVGKGDVGACFAIDLRRA